MHIECPSPSPDTRLDTFQLGSLCVGNWKKAAKTDLVRAVGISLEQPSDIVGDKEWWLDKPGHDSTHSIAVNS